jgi:tRNA-specific 2-thiouridylase
MHLKKQRKIKGKVLVAMSGGVDSSVSAALLKKAGFDVVGVFMKLNNLPQSKESEKRAGRIAKILKISFSVIDLRKEFKKKVIDCFLKEYKKGMTPNPCVICNKEIKFGLLLEKILKVGADFLATGHYVKTKKIKEKIHLFSGGEKDQSYFLWKLSQKQLGRVFFPVGHYNKDEVRGLAKEFKLLLLKIPESQEICFVPNDINDFLSRYFKPKPGKIIDNQGKILGLHQGLYFYTIGQRKGINLSGGPYYVLDKDLKKNNLVVTKKEKDLDRKELIAGSVNWILGKEPKFPLKVEVKIRYRHKPVSATVNLLNKKDIKVIFNKPQRAITPGQSVVFYNGKELLGGGIIC